MKFSEMPYARPDLNELKQQLQALTDRLKAAPDYAAAREAFLAQQKLSMHIDTLATLSSVRNSIDTRDKFYDAEEEFWNEAGPELRAYDDAWTAAMLESPFRKEFAAEYGDLMFLNAEIARKAFSPAIVEELKQENQLVQDYQKLIAGAQIDFEGSTYTISQLSPFKNSPDDDVRLAAWKAEGGWYKAHQPELDEIYDKLVRLRDAMGRKLGYDGFTQLGYYRMGRNCYTKEDVEKFRAAVVKYVVPVASSIYREQAARLGPLAPVVWLAILVALAESARTAVMGELRRAFRPEFLNRLDEIIMFKPLTKENLSGIIDILMEGLKKRLADKTLRLEVTDAAKSLIIERGFDPIYGARPLKRYLQSAAETLIAKEILRGDLAAGSTLVLDAENGELSCRKK